MIDLTSLSVILGGLGIVGVVSGFIGGGLRHWDLLRRMSCIEAENESLRNSIKGARGNEVKAEKAAELDAALVEIAGIAQKEGKIDWLKEFSGVVMRHPTVASDLLKQKGELAKLIGVR